jgi:site-specific recombinase XerD
MTTSEPVHFTIVRVGGQVTDCHTTSPEINHFLDLIKFNRAYNTWLNYTYDLKIFFEVIPKPPQAVTRQDCVAFLKHQQQAGLAEATINRRLAAVSSLFNELELLSGADHFRNPIQPQLGSGAAVSHTRSLYHRQAQRIPETIPPADLQRFFEALPTWRDRALMLLMWISCLRISEVVGIRWRDLECSHRSIRLPVTKGNHPRVVFMDQLTFGVLNRYLDDERRQLFPEVDAVFIAFKGKARGRPLTVNAVQKLIAYYAERCDLPYLHAHLFRHTGITQLVQQHMAEPAVRQFVGHRRPESLAPYLHLGDDFVAAEFERAQAAFAPASPVARLLTGGAR